MICYYCGKDISSTSDYCEHCGKPARFAERMVDGPKDIPPALLPRSGKDGGSVADEATGISRKLDAIAKRISELPTIRKQRRLQLLTVLMALLLLLANSLSVGAAERRIKKEFAAMLPTPASTATPAPTATPVPDYTVSYYADGADAEAFEENVGPIAAGTPYTIIANTPSNPGFRFLGWNTRPDGKGAQYAVGSIYEFDRDLQLYAQWEPLPTPTPTATPDETTEPTPTVKPVKTSAPTPTPTAKPVKTSAPTPTPTVEPVPAASDPQTGAPEDILPLQPTA